MIAPTFASLPIGARFVEVLSSCNEVAVKIAPVRKGDHIYNARRESGKLIIMADWEPVRLVEGGQMELWEIE